MDSYAVQSVQSNLPLGVVEMIGEFFREAAVLIFVFAPLEQAVKGQFTFRFQLMGFVTWITLGGAGILLERWKN